MLNKYIKIREIFFLILLFLLFVSLGSLVYLTNNNKKNVYVGGSYNIGAESSFSSLTIDTRTKKYIIYQNGKKLEEGDLIKIDEKTYALYNNSSSNHSYVLNGNKLLVDDTMDLRQYLGHNLVETLKPFWLFLYLQTPGALNS